MTTAGAEGLAPARLGPNQPPARPYRGGAGIVALRGTGSTAPDSPEDWVASTTSTHGDDTLGLTTLPDGRTLRDAVAADPVGWLGHEHVARHGADTGLLVKLLDTGERLFNHVHPDAAFAARHLGSDRGKTEAWLITATAEPTGTVWIGWSRDVGRPELAEWVERQDVDAMLDALNRLTVVPGDWVHVPAGTPHAIGPGITLVELQEPTDLSIVLEYEGFPALSREQAFLGLPRDTALDAVTTERLTPDRLAVLHGHADERAGRTALLPAEAAAFYRAERIAVTAPIEVEAGFAVLVVLAGAGTLAWAGGEIPVGRGATLVVPHGAGPLTLDGDLTVVRCTPPRAGVSGAA